MTSTHDIFGVQWCWGHMVTGQTQKLLRTVGRLQPLTGQLYVVLHFLIIPYNRGYKWCFKKLKTLGRDNLPGPWYLSKNEPQQGVCLFKF